jgi:hypothetical protein
VTDTPRTKEAARAGFIEGNEACPVFVVPWKMAEELERELNAAKAEVARVTAERDEARREICNGVARRNWPSSYHFDRMRRRYAADRGWDCFKEVQP